MRLIRPSSHHPSCPHYGMTYVFREHGDPFVAAEDEYEIYNLLTKEVLTKNESKDIFE